VYKLLQLETQEEDMKEIFRSLDLNNDGLL